MTRTIKWIKFVQSTHTSCKEINPRHVPIFTVFFAYCFQCCHSTIYLHFHCWFMNREYTKQQSDLNANSQISNKSLVLTCRCSSISLRSYVIPLGVITGSRIISKLILQHKMSGTSRFCCIIQTKKLNFTKLNYV